MRNRFHPGAGSGGVVKAIVVVAGLAVAALLVTALGVAKSDDWSGERTYRFDATMQDLASQGPLAAGAAPAKFTWEAPSNATAANYTIVVAFSGQAVQGGSAVVRAKATAPDGQTTSTTGTLAIPQGATSGELTLQLTFVWHDLPGKVRDTRQPDGLDWEAPLALEVTVERPSDLPVANYAFTATASGVASSFVGAPA